MQYTSGLRWHWLVLVCIGVLVVVSVIQISLASGHSVGPDPQQDVIRLESRLTQLEQRLYAIETSVRTLEQQSRLGSMSSRAIGPEDLIRLQSDMQVLQRRIIDDECGLAKLDERTLSTAMREARRKSGAGDPCRNNYESPLRLPADR